ncbi:hypothetical protein [Aureibaculum luteum]|uniref:hypothetical protein n=1 Tax=Aureibaculum luteum TaxID=1548456 RepID=UPI000E4D65AD|nr:hypothetical protein [Aureibaculum luteum]
MKRLLLTTAILVATFLITFDGNSQQEMQMSHKKKSNAKMEKSTSQIIKLKKGELFLVISSTTKPEVGNLMNDYFGKVFPVAAKNGFKPLANLTIDKIVSGYYKPNNFFGLYTWPSMMAVQAFLKELPNSELTPMRKKIWTELKQNIVSVEKDFEFTLYSDKIYEIQTIFSDMPIDEDKNKSLAKKYNGKIVLSFPIAGYEDLNNGKGPNQIVIIEWKSNKDATKYRTKKSKYMVEESFLTHLEVPKNK